jgi:hypothetical protein
VERTVRSWLWLVSVIVFILGPAWPLIFSESLATDWIQLSRLGWVLLAAALAMTVQSFVHTPALAHPGRQTFASAGRARTVASYGMTTPAMGLARLMWLEIALAVGFVAMMPALFNFFIPKEEMPGFMFLYFLPCMPSPRTMGPEAVLRSLRALPMSTWALAAILVAKPVMTYVAIWALQEILRSGFGISLPQLTPGTTCWLIGLASVITAANMKWSGRRWSRVVAVVSFGLAMFLIERLHVTFDLPLSWLPGAAAVSGIAVALALNFHTLRRSNSVYKAVKYPAMFATQGPPA